MCFCGGRIFTNVSGAFKSCFHRRWFKRTADFLVIGGGLWRLADNKNNQSIQQTSNKVVITATTAHISAGFTFY